MSLGEAHAKDGPAAPTAEKFAAWVSISPNFIIALFLLIVISSLIFWWRGHIIIVLASPVVVGGSLHPALVGSDAEGFSFTSL